MSALSGSDSQGRWARVEELFAACRELLPEQREAYLLAHTDDPTLRAEVRALLDAHSLPGIVDRLAARAEPAAPAPLPPLQRVGPYQVLHALGHGGMGSVYLAERADGQLRYRVALKLLRRDLDTPDLRDRFLAERQIVARINHPNITRLLDGGITDEGRPYFVMEYVDGLPIDQYCDEQRLPIGQRLELFRTVCAAVQHAHRNLVVHRDIKPANILVTADGTLKLLDFGIAKVLDPAAFPDTPGGRTRTGTHLMTPEYASPEQLRGDAVTTASDVYQLGLLLYDLLAGNHPRLDRDAGTRHVEKPSSFVTGARRGTPETGAAAAAARATTVQRLRRQLAGDIDNIVLRALRDEPDLRYASVEQLADDVRRHLAGLPVTARPDTWGYVATKFVRRHRVGVAATLASVMVLVAFGVATMIQSRRVAAERDRAQQVSDLLLGLFKSANPELQEGGDTLTVVGALDRGIERVRASLDQQPELQARMLVLIANVYWGLGKLERSSTLHREALALQLSTLGADHPATIATLVELAGGLVERGQMDSAFTYAERALELTERGHSRSLSRARALHSYSFALQVKGDRGRARPAVEEAIRLYRLHGDSASNFLASALLNLGWMHENEGRLDSAEAYMRKAVAVRRSMAGTPRLTNSLIALADVLMKQDRVAEAEPLVAEALAIARQIYPAGHRGIGSSLRAYAKVLARTGNLAAADTHYREALTMILGAYGERHLATGSMRNDYGLFLKDNRGDLRGAEIQFREAAATYAATRGPSDSWTALVLSNLAQTLYPQGRYQEAEQLFGRVIPALEAGFQQSDARLGPHYVHYGVVLHRRGKLDASAAMLQRGVEMERRARPAGDRRIARAEAALGACLVDLRRTREAEPLLLGAHRILSPDSRTDLFAVIAADALVKLYTRANRPAEADRFRVARLTATIGP
jgi:tetratricopeptide (TPR) repeat protein/tRNA A-37 threonylcarbamoyl transferase component Bud32